MESFELQSKHSKRLLILEDEQAQRETLTEIFRHEGFEVKAASCGKEALDTLQQSQDFCAAIVDLRLPDLSGKPLLEALHPYTSKIPIILHTAFSSYETARDAINIGAFAYVEKAGNPKELLLQVHRAINSRLILVAEYLEQAVADRTRALQDANDALKQREARLKTLTSELTLTEERLKNAIATRLHDNISQSLAMLRLSLGSLGQAQSNPDLKTALQHLYTQTGEILEDARYLTSELSYPALKLFGLKTAIYKWAVQEIQGKHGLQIQMEDDGLPRFLNEVVQAILFRGTRELLINVVKHAKATRVCIALTSGQKETIEIRITDNGTGMNNTQKDPKAGSVGFGLLSISEALESLGGSLTYGAPLQGQGCVACMIAPLRKDTNTLVSVQPCIANNNRDKSLSSV